MWVFGFAILWRSTPGASCESYWASRGDAATGAIVGVEGKRISTPGAGGVVQLRPGQLDFLQLAQNLAAKAWTVTLSLARFGSTPN